MTPSPYAGKHVWLLVLQGTRLIVLDHGRQTIAEHPLAERPGQVLTQREHYAALQRRGARTLALLSQEFILLSQADGFRASRVRWIG
ncbi:MAG: hypothetical protein U0821_22395 [Chloroflexota bacterium]